MSKPQYSTLPERIVESEYPETTAQHFPHEGLQTQPAGKERWISAQERPDYEEKQHAQQHKHNLQGENARRRCGLVPWLFWLLVGIAAVIVVVAAVVGGIVGSRSSSKNNQDSAAGGTAVPASQTNARTTAITRGGSSSTVPSQTSSSDASLTTQTLHAGDRTLYRDCPSSNDTIYTYGSASSPMMYHKWCNMACYNTQDWTAMINQDTDSLNDCIDLCAAYNVLLNETQLIDSQSSANSSVCNTVCWRWSPRDPDWPGHCFGFTSLNVSGHWNISLASECDSAGWINQYF